MKKIGLLLVALAYYFISTAQGNGYIDSLQAFRNNYIKGHEVVKDKEQIFLRFFPIDRKFVIIASFQKIYDAPWFKMETSGKEKKIFRVYGLLSFKLDNQSLTLQVYQSQDLMSNPEYRNYLFLPFTDKTSGEESYENGRYIDLTIAELDYYEILSKFEYPPQNHLTLDGRVWLLWLLTFPAKHHNT